MEADEKVKVKVKCNAWKENNPDEDSEEEPTVGLLTRAKAKA